MVLKRDKAFKLMTEKPPFYTPQEVYMTTIYDEMPRMTEKEIERWKLESREERVRALLEQMRMVKDTLTDLANTCSHHDVVTADGQAFTLTATIERIIDELDSEE